MIDRMKTYILTRSGHLVLTAAFELNDNYTSTPYIEHLITMHDDLICLESSTSRIFLAS